MSVLLIVGWGVCAFLAVLLVTRRIQASTGAKANAAIAVVYDALPYLLAVAWVVLVGALLTAHWALAIAAGLLGAYHVALLAPRVVSESTPHWVERAPRLTVVVANVFIDNATPDDAARQLVACDADVVVIVESTPAFMEQFDRAGGDTAFPHRVTDPDDTSDYAVSVVGRRPMGPRSEMRDAGPLRLAIADVDVDGVAKLLVALNPMAAVDPGGFDTWKEQIDALEAIVPTLPGPLVVVGDLNTTRYRPEFEALLTGRLRDGIDALGEGLSHSFKLGAEGALSSVGAVARLDHALVDDLVHPLSFEQLEPCGSDHFPFRLTMAVRAPRHRARRGTR
jgi:endonuclease/exonuclease/phosphatase (EEP) superfamily protein YafD